MIETGLTAATLILIVAAIMTIKGLRDRATRERHRRLEEQANIQRDRLREQRAQERLRTAELRTKRPTGPTVSDLRDNAKGYTPRHQRRDVTHTRTPGTDLGVTTNPALLYGATGTTGDTSTTSTTGDCGTTGTSSSSSSSSYDSGGSSSCDSGSGSF